MSKIGKKIITISDSVTVNIKDDTITVKGPKGELSFIKSDSIAANIEDKQLSFSITKKLINKIRVYSG